jgi:membrane-bound ClpP family serine protease
MRNYEWFFVGAILILVSALLIFSCYFFPGWLLKAGIAIFLVGICVFKLALNDISSNRKRVYPFCRKNIDITV